MNENNSHDSREIGPCSFCAASVDVDEYLCRGCGAVVCGDCASVDVENEPWGEHQQEDHPAAAV